MSPSGKTYAQIDADEAEYVRAANEALASLRGQGARRWYYSVLHRSFELVVGDAQGRGNLVLLLTACERLGRPVDWPDQQSAVVWHCDRECQHKPWEFILQDESAAFRAVAGTFGWRRDYDLVRYGGM